MGRLGNGRHGAGQPGHQQQRLHVAQAYAVNDAGTAVGYSNKYVGGSDVGIRAVIWLPDASAIDLNDLGVAPVSGGGTWTLTAANALSADGWVAGEGTFDPDGAGPLAAYTRLWVAQVGLGGTWTNAAGGTWGRGPNWSTGTPAMQVGNATFNLNSTYTSRLDRDERTKTIAVNAGTVTINGNGHTLTTESGLSIANGATLNVQGKLANNGSDHVFVSADDTRRNQDHAPRVGCRIGLLCRHRFGRHRTASSAPRPTLWRAWPAGQPMWA